MTTRFPQIEYLRSQTYGAYKGSGWDSSNETNLVSLDPQNEKPTSNVEHARVFVAAPPADVAFGQRVALTIDALYRSLARSFSPGFPVRIEYQGGVSLHDGDFLAMDRLVGQGRTFYQEALLPVTSPEFLRAAPPANREGLRDFYVRDVRDRIPPAVHSLARRIADRESNDYDLVRAFIAEIDRRCKYNLKADPIPRNADRVQAFLFDTHEGYCDLFASSLAVLCRTAGLRARVVTGYLVDHRTRRGDTYTIRDRDAHMWTEVYFQGYGWVPFDATADAEEVPGGGVGALLDDEESGGNLEFGAWIGGTVFGLALLALLIGSFRNRLTDRRAVDANMARLRPLYARYLRALQGTLRRPKSPGETTREYAAAFSLAAQDGQTAMRIAGAFENALYSSAPANGDLLRSLREDISKLDVQRSANGS
jgi:hypothetical protein